MPALNPSSSFYIFLLGVLVVCEKTDSEVFMEIDLNQVLGEVEIAADCNGNCNKSNGCVCSSNRTDAAFSPTYKELWHACAGPLITLPKKGNVVVYFPQGHLETSPFPHTQMSNFDLRPQIFCRVMDVQLLVC